MQFLRQVVFLFWAVVLGTSVSCVRLGFEQERQQGHDADVGVILDASHVDRAVGVADLAVDDGLAPDVVAPDSSGTPGTLTCSPPQLVGSDAPSYLSEAALRVDRLELVARDKSGAGYSTTRSSPNHPFGPWSPSLLLDGWADPTFYWVGSFEVAAVASVDVPRHLAMCKVSGSSSTCNAISIAYKQSGLSVTEDMDGPSVAVLPGTSLLMAHNLVTAAGETGIYLAQNSNTSSPTGGWVTEPVPAVNQPGVKEDDPALSPDGLALVYNFPDGAGMGELWVSERTSITAAFPQPRPLTEVNSPTVEGSAHLAPKNTTAGKNASYELFFSSDRNGSYVVYHSVCDR